MSKSDPSDMSRINLTDDADTIAKKILRAKTDSGPLPETLEELETRPEADNLVGIYAALVGVSKDYAFDVFAKSGGDSDNYFSYFKKALAEVAVEKLSPITSEMNRLIKDPAEIDRMLADGARRARAIAAPIMAEVKDIVGFVR